MELTIRSLHEIISREHSQPKVTYLHVMVFIKENIPCSKVSVNQLQFLDVTHTISNLQNKRLRDLEG